MSRMAASQLSSEDDFELIGGEVSPSSKSIGLSESSETLPTTQEVVEDDVAAPAAAEELPVQLPTSEDAAAADEDATREEGAEGAEVDDDDRSSEDDDFDERDPPRYLDLERVGARTAKVVWEADPVEVLDEAAAAAGVASERKRGPAFVVQIAEDSFWASWGDPVACADNCVRFVELTPSTAFVVRVARCIAAADDVEEGDDEDQLVRCVGVRLLSHSARTLLHPLTHSFSLVCLTASGATRIAFKRGAATRRRTRKPAVRVQARLWTTCGAARAAAARCRHRRRLPQRTAARRSSAS